MRVFMGACLFAGGILMGLYFFYAFNTSVPGGTGEVVNFALLSDRLCGMIASAALFIAGAVLLTHEPRKADP